MSFPERDRFSDRAEPYRRELHLHCYRMLGSLQDAEDTVQETFLRAWRGQADFAGRSSFRAWLYRIATNACLSRLARQAYRRRVLPDTDAPPSDRLPESGPASEIAWLDPYPDTAIENLADTSPGPEARYAMREFVQLAFVAAIQYLPPRQRAVLLLRDVLGWSTADTAVLLDTTVAAINSALQRARATLTTRFPTGAPTAIPAADPRHDVLIERYVRSWEAIDIDGFVALLREDAILTMPPWCEWYRGRDAIREFFAWAWQHGGYAAFRMIPIRANGQPAFAAYKRLPESNVWQAHSLHLLSQQEGRITGLVLFILPALFARFGLPDTLPDVPA